MVMSAKKPVTRRRQVVELEKTVREISRIHARALLILLIRNDVILALDHSPQAFKTPTSLHSPIPLSPA